MTRPPIPPQAPLREGRDTPIILLADDEAHITCVVAQKLRSAGFTVVTARDGEEAFEVACEVNPDLVITDLQMPRMSGLDLALKLRETAVTAHTPVVMLTARGYIIDPADARRTNIRHIMGKPFSAREVVRRVIELLGDTQGTGTLRAEAA
jgi:two-component system, OmpR family, alkaline phosphatase synthesis response regulator PhoP